MGEVGMKWAEYPLPWKMLWFLPDAIQLRIVRITYARYFCKWSRVSEGDNAWLTYRLTRLLVDELRIK